MATTPRVVPDDHHVKEAVLEELAWMPSIQSDRIGVAINNGAITLSGQVQTYPEKRAAVSAVFRVRGVTAVADQIEVHNPWGPRGDADIARDAIGVLERAATSPDSSVRAEVQSKVVTLTGSVAWLYQREAIGHAIAALPGVHDVSNLIELTPVVQVPPVTAREKIYEALGGSADIEPDQVTVVVRGSTITLSGRVDSWAQHNEADDAAWAIPGVTRVENHLRIGP